MISKYDFCSLAIIFTLLLINILILIFSIIFLYIPPYVVRENNNILKNWNSTIILDIKFRKDKCPYNFEPLELGYTNEIQSGLFCGRDYLRKYNYTNEDFNELTKGNYNEEDYNCRSVDNIPRKKIQIWRDTIICVLRSTKYFQTVMTLPYKNCRIGYLKCPHPVDTLNEFMCVKNLFECGINDMKVINKYEIYDKNIYSKLDFFDGQKSLLFARLIPNKPTIVDFKLTKGKVCANPLEVSQNKSYILYEFYNFANNCKTRINGENYNPYFNYLDTLSEINILTNLDLQDNFINLPIYPEKFLYDFDYNLYYTTFIGLQNYCYWDLNSIINYSNLENTEYNIEGATVAIVICTFIILLHVFLTFHSVLCINSNDEKKSCQSCSMVIIIPTQIALFIIAWVFFNNYNSIAFYKYLFQNYNDTVCFDDFHKSLLNYQNDFTSYYPNFFLFVALASTFMLVSICVIPILFSCLKSNFDWDFDDD